MKKILLILFLSLINCNLLSQCWRDIQGQRWCCAREIVNSDEQARRVCPNSCNYNGIWRFNYEMCGFAVCGCRG